MSIHIYAKNGAAFILTTIGLRIGTYFTALGPPADSTHPITRAIDIFQVCTFTWSLLTNLSATSIIMHKAW